MRLAQIKIIQDNDDGTWTETQAVLPRAIASEITKQVITWEADYLMTVEETREFIAEEKDFKVNRKK